MIWHDVEQNGEEWDALRLGRLPLQTSALIMANDGKAFGEGQPKRYALQLALSRLKGASLSLASKRPYGARPRTEPIARMLYEEMKFVDVDNGGFFDHETYGDSPDGLVGRDGVIEIKSVIAATHYATLTRGAFDPAYRWQIIGHLDCSGRDWVDFISYCSDFDGKQLIVYRLTAAECQSEIARLREKE